MAMATAAGGPELRQVPGGWQGSELDAESWRVAMPDVVREELLGAAASLLPDSVAADPLQRRPEVSARTASFAADLQSRLAGEPGFVVLTGFPVQEPPELIMAAYWVLGLLVGQPLRQGWEGELVCPVAGIGRKPGVPGVQGNRLPGALPFHVDRCTDLIGLLCVRPARSGGLSRLVSCKRLHNILLAERPDLLAVLYQPFPFSVPPLRGSAAGDAATWCDIPVFSRAGDHFAAYYMRRLIEDTQSWERVPRLTTKQREALDAVDEITSRPQVALEMLMRQGDIQIINNLHMLHSRTAYQDDDQDAGRLLLRIHLAFAGSPALPAGFTSLFGATAASTYRGGAWRTPELRDHFGTPLTPIASLPSQSDTPTGKGERQWPRLGVPATST